jgi:hypothetical protein
MHLHTFFRVRWEVFPDVVSPDGEFAVASINESGKTNALRPPKAKQGVDGGPYCAASIENVIYQHHDPAREISRKLCGKKFTHCALGEIITV